MLGVNPPDLQSLPQTQGSSINENISTIGIQVANVHPWVARDVENFAEISIDEMLKAFLLDCGVGSSDKHVLFKNSLEAVLPICNGLFQAMDLESNVYDVRYYLREYSKKYNKNKDELHTDFVKAANAALRYLQSLHVPAIRPCSNPVYFHVSNPSIRRQSHQGEVSERKPDIVLVSGQDAVEVCGSEKDPTNSRKTFTAKKPCRSPNWRSVRTFVVCKTSKHKMKPPPRLYTYQLDTQPPKHEYLGAHILDRAPALAQSYASSATPVCSANNSRPSTGEPLGQFDHLQRKASDSKRKRTLEQPEVSQSQSKRHQSRPEVDYLSTTQAGCCAAEMFAAHAGRLHVIGVIIIDDLLYLWRYDRQGVIQCSGFNFIQDLPRFLILLLTMQRFQNCHWGLNPHVDPQFGDCPKSRKVTLPGEQGRAIDVTLDLLSDERVTHYGLNGRATNVFPAKSEAFRCKDGIVAKLFWAEQSRTSEPEILWKVYEIAERHEEVRGHVPDMMCYHTYWDTSTALIRDRLGLKPNGARVLYLIVLRKLRPITELVETDFLRAWWATVKCHLTLWKNGVYHRDISPSNLMFKRTSDGKIMGVLNDFDLASIEDGLTGTERTGTVPFMALELLHPEGLRGQTKHAYEYDAESFIWALTWITLRYDNGTLRATGRPLDEWLGVNATTCRREKSAFLLYTNRRKLQAGIGHEENLPVAHACMDNLLRYTASKVSSANPNQVMEVDAAFAKLLRDSVPAFVIANK
ncbi:hypothetical protein BKA83DRAFT_4271284 [Pisolithus microcarpus]|nr:hypothetical protein BKA83DRAFT_4271284 [Pisolithus microcarpus]